MPNSVKQSSVTTRTYTAYYICTILCFVCMMYHHPSFKLYDYPFASVVLVTSFCFSFGFSKI